MPGTRPGMTNFTHGIVDARTQDPIRPSAPLLSQIADCCHSIGPAMSRYDTPPIGVRGRRLRVGTPYSIELRCGATGDGYRVRALTTSENRHPMRSGPAPILLSFKPQAPATRNHTFNVTSETAK